jgi:ssDNA-binding Zn-finger/Zn-ribbon topoisomerase 1
MIARNRPSKQPPLPPKALADPDTLRCPRCGDDLALYHSHSERRPHHFLGCLSYPRCSYTRSYDEQLHAVLQQVQARLTWVEAQYAWLLVQVEALTAHLHEVES